MANGNGESVVVRVQNIINRIINQIPEGDETFLRRRLTLLITYIDELEVSLGYRLANIKGTDEASSSDDDDLDRAQQTQNTATEFGLRSITLIQYDEARKTLAYLQEHPEMARFCSNPKHGVTRVYLEPELLEDYPWVTMCTQCRKELQENQKNKSNRRR